MHASREACTLTSDSIDHNRMPPSPPASDPASEEEAPIDAGSIRILPARYEVFIDARPVQLTLTQFRILSIMAKRPGWVFTPQQIARSLSRSGIEVEASAMRNHIYMMRRKLGRAGGKQLETVRGVGYRVAADHFSDSRDDAEPAS